jgi:DNA-binding NarL/FixJ family response regulator
MGINKAIRVFLADDHPLLRIGLRLSFEQRDDIELIGEADEGFSAVEKIQATHPEVSLIDIDMPGLSGIGVIRLLRKSNSQMIILVLSSFNDETYIQEAMAAGADGYVLKCIGVNELGQIIKSFYAGKPMLSPYLVNLTVDSSPRANEQNLRLSFREQEVLKAVAGGKGNKEISDVLFISPETVKSHIKKIFKKLNVKNRVEAAKFAIERNLVD